LIEEWHLWQPFLLDTIIIPY
jgi:hypothetical protein